MTTTSNCKSSNLVDVLRHYGPVPRNDNQYDERVQSMHKRKGVEPLSFAAKYQTALLANFRDEQPCSVILTGTAGDGKTYYCRQVWHALGGDADVWSSEDKVRTLRLSDSSSVVVVKDLTELQPEEQADIFARLANSVFSANTGEVFLIAANDGQLIKAINEQSILPNVEKLKYIIEDLLVEDIAQKDQLPLQLYNLSRLQTSELFPSILLAVLDHPAWQDCDGCAFGPSSPNNKRCPIFENRARLKQQSGDEYTFGRLLDLLRLCDLDSLHLPVRQQLLLVANALLGHPDGKDYLLRCSDVPAIVEAGRTSYGSVYSNIFGENLPERRRESIDVFETLGRFGIGSETSNKIDNLLIFGADDTELSDAFQSLVLADPIYGADKSFKNRQFAYLEASAFDERVEFLDSLRRQRQRLFFVIPQAKEQEFRFWELTLYHSAGDYLEQVHKALLAHELVPKLVAAKLVKGLNRIFTGLLGNNQTDLILATSGHYSQAKVSNIFEERIAVTKRRGEFVSVEWNSDRRLPELRVSVSNSESVQPATLGLSLTRFEYLCRVADGALPTSFSQECYEDILAFKTRILRKLAQRKSEEDADEEPLSAAARIELRLVELSDNGIIIDRTLEI